MTVDLQELKLGDKLTSYNQFTSKIRDFIRERAELERDFSRKLDYLAKKHSLKKKNDQPFIKRYSKLIASSMKDCWEKIVSDTNNHSRLHAQLADILNQSVADKLKALSTQTEESRKKQLLFANKLANEFESVNQKVEKSRDSYMLACDQVELAREKFERATDEKSIDKCKRYWHQEILDMNNSKNNYLLSIDMANKFHQRYCKEYIPHLLKQFQVFGQRNNNSVIEIWKTFVSAQKDILRYQTDIVDGTMDYIGFVDSAIDTEIAEPKGLDQPLLFQFEPSVLWKDDDEMVTDEYSSVYLGNKLELLDRKANQLIHDIKSMEKGLVGLESLVATYRKNPLQGDADKVEQELQEEEKSIFLATLALFNVQNEIECIKRAIGGFPLDSSPHKFKPDSFPLPTTCDYCQQNIWGVSKAGISCQECSFHAHVKCEMKVPPTCTGVKRLSGKKKRASSDPTKKYIMQEVDKPKKEEKEINYSLTRMKPRDSINRSTQIPENVNTVPELEPAKVAETATPKEIADPVKDEPKLNLQSEIAFAKVLYDYFATNGEEVTIFEGETVQIMKHDDGLGWTMVYKDGSSGVVPTTYISVVNEHTQESCTTLSEDKDKIGIILYGYLKNGKDEITVSAGEHVKVVQKDDGSGWVLISGSQGQGLIPATYIR
ncbi:hypothetical protein HDV06_004296 [Boothiomyces sp. JEL0866]|nr:hypothetical protein HDV06_004296 [Boothiomyces sp. JEL0866]